MERLQGPINPSFYGACSDMGCSRQELSSLEFDEFDEAYLFTSSLDEKMPFLHMLQCVEEPFKEPSFQNLLKLQQHLSNDKPWKQEVNSASCRASPECNQNGGLCRTQMENAPLPTKERRKRKRLRPAKNKEEVESQRMTHIAVERNRRRQMNDHLNVIKSLIPTSYIQRGDQASIIGGAIDFVKELEQLLECLEAQRKERKGEGDEEESPTSSSATGMASNGRIGEGVCAEVKSEVGEIEVTMIQAHVNLKIKCPKRQGQLLKAIVALEDLRLSVLHLNISTSQATATVLYSFNLRIEDECKLGSAVQIAGAVHEILSFISDGSQVNGVKGNFRQYSGSG
ncbi:Transcription factor basic helix-loop-helix 70, partial [Cucurbita argyrosperma subsp. sororia]